MSKGATQGRTYLTIATRKHVLWARFPMTIRILRSTMFDCLAASVEVLVNEVIALVIAKRLEND